MSIFRFSARDGTYMPDIQISEHDSLDAARREAVTVLHKLAQVTTFGPAETWQIDVADEEGHPLFTVSLKCDDTA